MPTGIWKLRLRSSSAHCGLEVAVGGPVVQLVPLRDASCQFSSDSVPSSSMHENTGLLLAKRISVRSTIRSTDKFCIPSFILGRLHTAFSFPAVRRTKKVREVGKTDP